MADPFDVTNSDTPDNGGGMLGVSPDAWRNLMAFGAATTAAANQRDGRGFLTYGTGPYGALGAGALGAMDQSRTNAGARSEMARAAATRGYIQSQTQEQQLKNELLQTQMPFARAKSQMQMQMLNGMMGGQPAPLPGAGPAMAPQSNAAPAGGGAVAAIPGEYLPFYKEASQRTGIPIEVLAAQHQQESGFDNARIGKAGEIGIGQVLPSTAANPGFGMAGIDPKALSDPRTNINFSADYLKARGGLAAYNGGGDPNYVQHVQTRMPAGQSVAGAGFAPYQVAGNGPVAPPSGAPAATPSPTSPQSGIGPQGQLPPNLQGMKNQADALMAHANRLEFLGLPGADTYKAQAQNMYKVVTDTMTAALKPRDIRQGGMDLNPVTGQVTMPPMMKPFKQADGSVIEQPVDPQTGAVVPGSMPRRTAIPLADETNLKERGQGWAKREAEINEQASNAVGTNNSLDNMRMAATGINMGAGASSYQTANTWLLSAGKALGMDTSGLQEKVANSEDFNKNSIAMVSQATKAVSPRASQQEMQYIAKSQPSLDMSRGGFNMIADQMQGVNDFTIARAKALDDYINGNEAAGIKPHGNSGGFDVWFNQQVTPAAFTISRMKQSPEGLQRLDAMAKDLVKTPEGKQALKGMIKHYSTAQSLGLVQPPDADASE